MSEEKMATAKQKYDEFMAGNQELSAIERLRFFCSCAMSGQDWLDVESFFDDLAAHPSAQAIETAAILKCAEVCDLAACDSRQRILALIPQDGRTALEEFGMKVAESVADSVEWAVTKTANEERDELRAIVTNLIGEGK